MADIGSVPGLAGLNNPQVRHYVRYWAEFTGAARVEVVSAADDARLIPGSLDAGEIHPAGDGLYYSRSYDKDTADRRGVVASSEQSLQAGSDFEAIVGRGVMSDPDVIKRLTDHRASRRSRG